MVNTGFSIQYDGEGLFTMTVDGQSQTFNISDMDLALRMEQVEIWDQEIADQYAEIKESNMKRKQLNELLAQMRKAKAEGRDDDTVTKNITPLSLNPTYVVDEENSSPKFQLEGTDGESRSIDGWLNYFGFSDQKTDVQHNTSKNKRNAQWDVNIELVKGKIDQITSDTELKMLRFRQLVDKRGTALQEAKSTMQQDKRLKDQVLQG